MGGGPIHAAKAIWIYGAFVAWAGRSVVGDIERAGRAGTNVRPCIGNAVVLHVDRMVVLSENGGLGIAFRPIDPGRVDVGVGGSNVDVLCERNNGNIDVARLLVV